MSTNAFSERVRQDAKHSAYYDAIRDCLFSYKGVKGRLSIRCDSYRYKGKLLAKYPSADIRSSFIWTRKFPKI